MPAAFADDPANLIQLLCVYQSVEKTNVEQGCGDKPCPFRCDSFLPAAGLRRMENLKYMAAKLIHNPLIVNTPVHYKRKFPKYNL
jgi:hypothetical protein